MWVIDKNSAVNPSYQEIVNYINDQCNAIGIPVDIGLAIAWTESGMTQFGEKDKAKKCINKEGEITSTDWGGNEAKIIRVNLGRNM